MVFGLRPSPAILGAVISHHLEQYHSEEPELVKLIESSLYVDDLVCGAEDEDKAFEYYTKSKAILFKAGMNLRKWNSNSNKLMKRIQSNESLPPSSHVVTTSKVTVTEEEESYAKSTTSGQSCIEGASISKLFGLLWDSQTDHFTFDFTELIEYARNLSASRRSLLKVTAKIFDPLGFLSPFVIRLKILFQTLCVEGHGWDQPLENEMLKFWNSLIQEFKLLNNLKFSRCYFLSDMRPTNVQLQCYSDASSLGYTAVIYIHSEYPDGTVDVKFVASKTCVAPVKQQSIPRLELLGAVILARLSHAVLSTLPEQVQCFYWVDSMTVLCWIQHNKPWKKYVSHRVKEIHQLIDKTQWYHCPGILNPADLPSRGISGGELLQSTIWWNGPAFLQLSKDKWPITEILQHMNEITQSKLIKNAPSVSYIFYTTVIDNVSSLDKAIDYTYFGSMTCLLRVTAFVLSFINKLKS